MNQGRIWCVVNPTVGLPLFLGSVALTSLAVHYSVLSRTTWMGSYWEGGKAKKASLEGSVSPVAMNATAVPGFVISVAPASSEIAKSASSFVVTVAPAQTAAVEEASVSPSSSISLAALVSTDEK